MPNHILKLIVTSPSSAQLDKKFRILFNFTNTAETRFPGCPLNIRMIWANIDSRNIHVDRSFNIHELEPNETVELPFFEVPKIEGTLLFYIHVPSPIVAMDGVETLFIKENGTNLRIGEIFHAIRVKTKEEIYQYYANWIAAFSLILLIIFQLIDWCYFTKIPLEKTIHIKELIVNTTAYNFTLPQMIPEDRLVQQISFSQNSVLAWLGVGLASFIGIVELLERLNKLNLSLFLLYEGLVVLVITSFHKVLDHMDLIYNLKKELPVGWDVNSLINKRLTSNAMDSILGILLNNRCIENIFTVSIFILATFLLIQNSDIIKKIESVKRKFS